RRRARPLGAARPGGRAQRKKRPGGAPPGRARHDRAVPGEGLLALPLAPRGDLRERAVEAAQLARGLVAVDYPLRRRLRVLLLAGVAQRARLLDLPGLERPVEALGEVAQAGA